jgi:hypothetical protein
MLETSFKRMVGKDPTELGYQSKRD